MSTDVLALLAIVAVVAVAGVALGMLVAPTIGRFGDPERPDEDEEDGG